MAAPVAGGPEAVVSVQVVTGVAEWVAEARVAAVKVLVEGVKARVAAVKVETRVVAAVLAAHSMGMLAGMMELEATVGGATAREEREVVVTVAVAVAPVAATKVEEGKAEVAMVEEEPEEEALVAAVKAAVALVEAERGRVGWAEEFEGAAKMESMGEKVETWKVEAERAAASVAAEAKASSAAMAAVSHRALSRRQRVGCVPCTCHSRRTRP